jgi:hypothetical protein
MSAFPPDRSTVTGTLSAVVPLVNGQPLPLILSFAWPVLINALCSQPTSL